MKKYCEELRAIKKAFFYSMSGFRFLIQERAFKQELQVFSLLAMIEAFFRHTSTAWLLYMFTSAILVLISEAINSAVEATVDRISLENHELSKKAKDIASAGTFIAMVHFAVVWVLSFF